MDAAVTALRLRLRAAGFSPLPIKGKAPSSVNGWQTKLETSPDEIRLWETLYPYDTNTGVLTKFTPAVDIDILDEAAAEAVEMLAREQFEDAGSILVRIGKAPKRAVLLRSDEPFGKITANLVGPNGAAAKIEFLASGQQLVVAGIHPETRQPYRWHGGEPGQTSRADLPEVCHGDAQRFMDDATALLIDQFGYRRPERPKPEIAAGGDVDWLYLVEAIRDGLALHDATRDLGAKLVTAGMTAGAAVNVVRALMDASAAPHDARWRARYADIPRLVAGATARPAEPLHFVNMESWNKLNVPPRQWAVRDRLPLRQPALFSGEGATGKTIIELQLCAAHVLGRDWLDTQPERGAVIYLGAEDEADELHRRLADIANHYRASFADLIDGGLHLICLVGKDALLGVPDRTGRIVPTALFNQLIEAAADIKPVHIGIDTSADVFGGNEIDRGQVRQFVGLLRQLAIAANGAVVLLSHPSLQGISSGSGLSGSTGWHNSVRARMYLRSPAEKDEQPDTDLRELLFLKNNYGRLAEHIILRYRNGVFVPEPSMSMVERATREKQVDDAFLAVLGKLIAGNRPINPSPNASNYAPTAIAGHPAGKAYTRKDYQAAMERLLDAGKIHIKSMGPPSKQVRFLALGRAPS